MGYLRLLRETLKGQHLGKGNPLPQPTNKQGRQHMLYVCIYRCGHKDTAEIDEPYADKAWNNPDLCAKCKTKANDKKKKGVKK